MSLHQVNIVLTYSKILVEELPEKCRNRQSFDAYCAHVDSPSESSLFSILRENIHPTRVVKSTEELGTILTGACASSFVIRLNLLRS